MNDYTFHETHNRCRRHGIVRTALMWAGIALVAMLVFGAVTAVFGLVFHLAVLLIKVALVAALAAFIWRRVTRRRHYDHNYNQNYGQSDRHYSDYEA